MLLQLRTGCASKAPRKQAIQDSGTEANLELKKEKENEKKEKNHWFPPL